MNSTQTKKSKNCFDFHARDESQEMFRSSFHLREEIEEILDWRVVVPIFCQLSALAVRDASLMSLYIVEKFTSVKTAEIRRQFETRPRKNPDTLAVELRQFNSRPEKI